MSVAEAIPAPTLPPAVSEVQELYERLYPTKEGGVFTKYDWKRCTRALDFVDGRSVLEVGVGAGQLFHILARTPSIERLVGVDIAWNEKLVRPERGVLELGSVLGLAQADASFDTVLCMEVLEHLEPIDFPKALYELRRVCGGTLIMTVPFEEPEPLWHHDQRGGHRQRFDKEKLERWFPRAERKLIRRAPDSWPWVMLIERRGASDDAPARR